MHAHITTQHVGQGSGAESSLLHGSETS